MSKQCITYREYKLIIDDLRKQTDIFNEGTDYCYENDSNKRKNFYWNKWNMFPKIGTFIRDIHTTYGKNIDVRLLAKMEQHCFLTL